MPKKGGGSYPIQKGFIRKTEIFWHIWPKRVILSAKTGHFLPKRGESGPIENNPYQKKTEVGRGGVAGGVSGFRMKVKK